MDRDAVIIEVALNEAAGRLNPNVPLSPESARPTQNRCHDAARRSCTGTHVIRARRAAPRRAALYGGVLERIGPHGVLAYPSYLIDPGLPHAERLRTCGNCGRAMAWSAPVDIGSTSIVVWSEHVTATSSASTHCERWA